MKIQTRTVLDPQRQPLRMMSKNVTGTSSGHTAFAISPASITRLMLLIVAVLTSLSLGIRGFTFLFGENFFPGASFLKATLSLNREHNIPAWYQSTVVATCGILLMIIADERRRSGQKKMAASWALLSVALFYVSLDEITVLHERSVEPVRSLLGITGGFLYFAWVIPAMAIVFLFSLMLIPLLRKLPARTLKGFLLAGAVFITGAVGFEMLGAGIAVSKGQETIAYNIIQHVEEVLEMLGFVIFLRVVLEYMASHGKTIALVDHR